MEPEYYCLADIWGKYMRKVTLPLKFGPSPPVRGTDQRGERRGQFLILPNAYLTQTNEKSVSTEVSHGPQGQGGPSSTPKRSPHEQSSRYPLDPPSRDAQDRQRLSAQGVSETSTCQAQITLTTKIAGVTNNKCPHLSNQEIPFKGQF